MPCDLVVAAIVGTAGVAPTHAAIQQGRTIALANKETLVCAGYPVMADAARFGSQILPMDSEHNAIFQCLGQRALVSVEKLVLTASGGPFRTWSKEKIAAASRDQALAHPNWSMGPKVTVDSASLMNKGLELIEAHHIFEVDAKRLDVVVHPQSIVHGLVYFEDGAVTAGLAPPDMRVPIAHCLTYPDRLTTHVPRLDLTQIGQLTFEKPDFERFPCLGLALAALQQGGALPTILNAANEIAVEGFLSGQLSFSQIAGLVDQICQTLIAMGIDRRPDTVEEALAVDHITRERARAILAA
jgi:1-deoxy-D-xylulose-5-phosphate reductoisomerase